MTDDTSRSRFAQELPLTNHSPDTLSSPESLTQGFQHVGVPCMELVAKAALLRAHRAQEAA